jgi:hypothetical protein
MSPAGQTLAHFPQPTHLSESTAAQTPRNTRIAALGQAPSHEPQATQFRPIIVALFESIFRISTHPKQFKIFLIYYISVQLSSVFFVFVQKTEITCYYSNPTQISPGSEPAGLYWLPHVASSTFREPNSPAEPDLNEIIAAFE